MPDFLFAYHAGSSAAPRSDASRAEERAEWAAWIDAHQSALTHPGAPVGPSTTVRAAGVESDGGANPVAGFSIVSASDLEAAVAIAQSCPMARYGGSIEIAEIMGL